jgi:hypothetical protein
MIEYRRFTLAEVQAGAAAGWSFSSGWFPLPTVLSLWAWFRRKVTVDG